MGFPFVYCSIHSWIDLRFRTWSTISFFKSGGLLDEPVQSFRRLGYYAPALGIILNYIIPVITLFSAEAYSNWNIFLSKRYFSIEATYIIGILTTYIMSGLGWFFSGTAGNGSSLIAFCLYATFTVKIIIDSVGGFQNRRRNVSAKFEVAWGVFITLILAILVVPFFFVSVIGYIAQREFNHFVGLGVFCLLSALLIADRIQYQKKLDS